jgi:PAS domain S-box-containing protein
MRSRTSPLVGAPRWVRALQVLTALVIAAYAVWTLPGVRPGPAFDVAYDGVLQGLGYTLVAVLALTGAALRTRTSAAWWLVAAAVSLRAMGFVLALTAIGLEHPLPYPSIADAAWVLSSLCLIGGVVLRLHDLAPRASRLTVLDGIAAALLVVALALGILASPIRTLTSPGTPDGAVAVNIGYPVLDTVLLVAAAALVTTVRLRLTRADHLLLGGVVAFAAVDVVYFVLLAQGRWRPGSLLASLSLVATAVIATAVWSAPGRTRDRARALGEAPAPTPEPGIALPASLVAVAVLALAFTDPDAVPVSLYCYLAALVVVVCRGLLTVVGDREEADLVLGEAYEDAQRFRSLVEASSSFIGMADVRGHVLYLNPQARRMIGVGPDDDIASLTVPQIVPNEGNVPLERRWRTLLEQGSWEGQSAVRRLDGGPDIPVTTSTFVVRDTRSGEPFAVATIQRDIREQLAAQQDLRILAEQRATLLHRLVQAQEDERSRIAADVHDDSVQALAAVDLRLAMLVPRIIDRSPELADSLRALQDTVTDATERLRHLLFDLESPARRSSLAESLDEAAAFLLTEAGIRWRVTGDLDVQLPEAERVTAYRVGKEALANVGKHSRATHVEVALAQTDGGVSVVVRDDGVGVEPEDLVEQPGHLGIASMHNRADVAGGRLEVRRGVGGGTEVHLWLPSTPATA